MVGAVKHERYGNITYDENFWTGRKVLTVDGKVLKRVSKNSFLHYLGPNDSIHFIISGSIFTGVSLKVGNESIQIIEKTKWYEYALAIMMLVFNFIWGNSKELNEIFPIVGGGIGGFLTAFIALPSLIFMKKAKKPVYKVLIGIAGFAISVLLTFLVGLLLSILLLHFQNK